MARYSGMKYKGTKTLVNPDTGVVEEYDSFIKYVGRNEPFMITYMNEIINLFDVIGNKKLGIMKYIIKEMNKSNNVLMITTKELASKTNTSRQTVSDTLKILEEAQIISRKIGAIMVNPRLINNKKAWKETQMIIQYQSFGKGEED